METALLKTTFWDDDTVYQLNIDTKLLYLFLNSAPERNTTRFYKLPDRLISAHIGLSDSALRLCKSQLEDLKLVFFKDGWVILGDSSYVKPSRGKGSDFCYQQDVDKVPVHIKEFALFYGLNFELSTGKSSRVAQELNNNTNDNSSEVIHREDKWAAYKCDEVFEEASNGDVRFKRS